MKVILILILFLPIAKLSFSQDTLQWSKPPNGFFWVEKFDATKNSWLREEYDNWILFSKEELDSSKFYPIGDYTEYYENGNILFIRQYKFDGQHSEVHGKKQIFYPNSRLKEDGQYHHSIKIGKWSYYAENGDILKTVEYNVPFSDTITNVKFLKIRPFAYDEIIITEPIDYTSSFPIIDFGKNGFEIHYQNNLAVKLIYFENGQEIFTETNQKKIRKIADLK